MLAKKILFVNQEITPYLEVSHLSVVGRYLPQSIQERGLDIRTFMPGYKLVNERKYQLHEVIRLSGLNIPIGGHNRTLHVKVGSIQAVRLQTYFIENEDFFQEGTLFDKYGKFYTDNDERAMFFAKGVLETTKNLGWSPDIIHCQGWIASLVPLYVKVLYKDNPIFANTKVIYSVFGDTFTKSFRSFPVKLKSTGIPASVAKLYKQATCESTTKTAIDFSDAVVIAEDSVPAEIKDYVFQSGKHFFVHRRDHYADDYVTLYNTLVN
ncbi:MAG: glycogen/starch synthase [Bacteroidales bacterium]|jgi:starch synthase|nr:glycogen/starch synthase [Bacteroidales bacterium]